MNNSQAWAAIRQKLDYGATPWPALSIQCADLERWLHLRLANEMDALSPVGKLQLWTLENNLSGPSGIALWAAGVCPASLRRGGACKGQCHGAAVLAVQVEDLAFPGLVEAGT